MSQLSQFSEGGLSDIIKDVDIDDFIEENGITEDVKHLLGGVSNNPGTTYEDDKANLAEVFGAANYPQPDIKLKFPPEEQKNVGTEEYVGPYDFEVFVVTPNEQKTPWEFSAELNKLFIGIDVKFPVAFRVKNRPNINLFVRATPVFSQSQFFQEMVHRCVAHRHPKDNSNKGLASHIFQHIVRCTNDQSRYFGDKYSGVRLSLVIPLGEPETGSELVKEFYYFVCQNSCPSGMNRKPVDMVFTLENENGEVLGRRLFSVRVCSSAKRDRRKEEKQSEQTNPRKKRKIENKQKKKNPENHEPVDIDVYPLNIGIVGKKNYLHLLNVARDRMAFEVLNSSGQNQEIFQKCYNGWCALIEKSESK